MIVPLKSADLVLARLLVGSEQVLVFLLPVGEARAYS